MAAPQSFNNAYPAGPQFASPYEAFRAGNLQKIYYRQVRDLRVGKIGLFFYKKNHPIYSEITEFNRSGITFTSLKSRTDDPPIVHTLSISTRQGEWEFMEEATDFPIADGYRPIRKDDINKNGILMVRSGDKFIQGDVKFIDYEKIGDRYTFIYNDKGKEKTMTRLGGFRKFDWEALTKITYTAPLTLTPIDPSFGSALRSAAGGGGVEAAAGSAGGGGGAGAGAPNANSRKSKKSRKQRKNRRNRRKTRR